MPTTSGTGARPRVLAGGARACGEGLFTGWPRLVPVLQARADETLG
ncbi:MAG TPA: hypothetical protein VFV73_39360 [Streptosporangiaceae bacterium]|nr:hypothetical protein [Streptosporangiaceae bacterium]